MTTDIKSSQVHQMDSLLGFAMADTDTFGLFSIMPPAEVQSSKSTANRVEHVDVEAITLQILSDLDGDFHDLENPEILEVEGFDPIPVGPLSNSCESSVVVPTFCPSSRAPPATVNPSLMERRPKRSVEMLNQIESRQHSTKRQRCVSPSDSSFEDKNDHSRFRDYQAEQWTEKFEELCEFVKKNGHCQVPHGYPENQSLARWTKRQRYQYKLKGEGKASTMTDDRIAALNALGFVWNSHGAVWEERLNELKEFKKEHGHCNVPSQYDENQKLATWVKCQRRQYKLFTSSKRSNMTIERVNRLMSMDFVWEIRSHTPKQNLGSIEP